MSRIILATVLAIPLLGFPFAYAAEVQSTIPSKSIKTTIFLLVR